MHYSILIDAVYTYVNSTYFLAINGKNCSVVYAVFMAYRAGTEPAEPDFTVRTKSQRKRLRIKKRFDSSQLFHDIIKNINKRLLRCSCTVDCCKKAMLHYQTDLHRMYYSALTPTKQNQSFDS